MFFIGTIKFLMLALITSLLIISCKQAPKASDSEVKNKVIESAINEICEKASCYQRYMLISSMRGDKDAFKNEDNKWLEKECKDLEIFENYKDKLKVVLDSSLKEGNITIENIRVDNSNNELRKCECSADLNLGLISYKISYIAQYTEEGKLVVETQFK